MVSVVLNLDSLDYMMSMIFLAHYSCTENYESGLTNQEIMKIRRITVQTDNFP